MEQLQNAPEITLSSLSKVGGRRGNWRSERVFLASKACVFCGKEFRPWIKKTQDGKIISVFGELAWNRQVACSISCSKRFKNPMSNHQVKLRQRARLKEINHKPIKRGGNGQLLPLPQLALLHALGEGWEAEYSVATKMRHLGTGYPTCYKIDIANPIRMIAIEVDGGSHTALAIRERDKKKAEFLVSRGWSVYRVSNERALFLYSTFKSVDTLLISLTGD